MAAPEQPFVSILLVNYNGERHLSPCLDSLAQLDYPCDRYEILVIDNGSSDGSLRLLSTRYPDVRVLPQGRNVGFAAGNNVGADASDANAVALLNTDMVVDPAWLTELVAVYDPGGGVACVSALILNWTGERLDFGDGSINYHAFGEQLGMNLALDHVHVEDRELPFACGGAMLIDRKLFLQLGGFDPKFFAYFEDVDLGWRLRLAGHRIRLAAKARVKHRHHGTSGSSPPFQRDVLYERNALRMLIKNLEEKNLGSVLSAALLLLGERAALASGSDRREFDLGVAATQTTEEVSRHALAPLHAVSDVISDLGELMEQRRRVQALRRIGDDAVFEHFGRPFKPLGNDSTEYVDAMTRVTHAFRFDELFAKRRATRIAVVATRSGDARQGPACRPWEIARALGLSAYVLIATEDELVASAPGVEIVGFDSEGSLLRLVAEADAVLLHGDALERFPGLRRISALKVVDLDDPWPFELPVREPRHDRVGDERIATRNFGIQRELLDAGDFFICGAERHRDYWLGMLSARGRIDRATYEADPTLRSLIDVVEDGSDWTTAVEPLGVFVAEPWRWESMRAQRATPVALTEDAQLLLTRTRHATTARSGPGAVLAPIFAPTVWSHGRVNRAARYVWWRVPEPTRARFRPLLRRAQSRTLKA